MKKAKILLLTYFYDYDDMTLPVVKDIVARYSGNVYIPFPIYFYEPLKEIFSDVTCYDYLKRAAEIGHKAMNREIIEMARRERFQYVIWTSYYYDVFPSTLDKIRETGSTVIGWYFDDEWRFDEYSKYWIPYLDYSVIGAIETMAKYQALNASAIHTIPNTGRALSPDWAQIKEKYKVSFVGTKLYANRPDWFEKAAKLGVHIEGFGKGWEKYVPFEEMLKIFQTSKINLNFSGGGPYGHEKQLKGRIFQVCMAGGFLLTEYVPEIEQYFIIDKEIVCFHTPEEMAEKIAYYLAHDEERRAIARAGWEKASREYTSTAMTAKVFEEIEAANRQSPPPNPSMRKIPREMRRQMASYYTDWFMAQFKEKQRERCKETLLMTLRHNPFNMPSAEWWGSHLIIFLPLPLQNFIRKMYRNFGGLLPMPVQRIMRGDSWHPFRGYGFSDFLRLANHITDLLPMSAQRIIRRTYRTYLGNPADTKRR